MGYNAASAKIQTAPAKLSETMSAKALDLYRTLREGGMGEDAARKTAEALDARIDESRRESDARLDEAVQNAAEKIRAETVSADEYHQRMEKTPTRAENETEYAKLREEIKALRDETRAGFARFDRFFLALLLGLVFLVIEKIVGFF